MAEPLRELLAVLDVQVDPAGNVARGSAAVDALQRKIESVSSRVGKTLGGQLSAGGGLGWGRQMSELFGGMGIRSSGPGAGSGAWGAALGAQIQRGVEANRATHAASEAAAVYAQTLRGRLQPAVDAFRASFGSASSGGGGGGFIGALRTGWQWATSLRTAMAGLGLAFAGARLAQVIDQVGGIGEAAAKLGVTTDEFQRLDVLARQNATDVGALGTAFRTLAKQAADPTKDSSEAFARLGVSVRGADGQLKSTNELFFESAEALSSVSNETERTALATKLYGRSATELKALLAGGPEALRAQREELAKLSVVSAEQIQQADRLADTWTGVAAGLRAKLVNELFPKLIPLLQRFVDWLGSPEFDRFAAKAWRITKAVAQFVGVLAAGAGLAKLGQFVGMFRALVGLSGGLGPALGSVAGSVAKLALSVAKALGPLLILEDLVVFLMGGDSLIGRGIDRLFGKGVSYAAFEGLRDVLKDIVSYIKQGINLVIEWWNRMPGTSKIKPLEGGSTEERTGVLAEVGQGVGLIAKDLLSQLPDVLQYGTLGLPLQALSTLAPAGLNGALSTTNNLTINVNSTAEIQSAVAGAQRGMQAGSPAASYSAVGGAD